MSSAQREQWHQPIDVAVTTEDQRQAARVTAACWATDPVDLARLLCTLGLGPHGPGEVPYGCRCQEPG